MKNNLLKQTLVLLPVALGLTVPAHALPPPEDTPEEILRTEIITEARSPLDGKPISAADYAQLQEELRTGPPQKPQLAPKIRQQIGLLRARRFLKTFFPFLPIR